VLLFHYNNGWTNASNYYVYTYISCLLTLKQLQCFKRFIPKGILKNNWENSTYYTNIHIDVQEGQSWLYFHQKPTIPTTSFPVYFTNLSRKVRGVYFKPTDLSTKHATDTAHSNPWHQFRWHKLQASFVLFLGKHFMTTDIVIYPADGTCKYLLNFGRYTASRVISPQDKVARAWSFSLTSKYYWG